MFPTLSADPTAPVGRTLPNPAPMFWWRSRESRFLPFWAITIIGTMRRLSKPRSKIEASRYYVTAQFPWNADTVGFGSPESMMRWSERRTWARHCAMSSLGNHSVACPRARLRRLRGAFPGRLAIVRTLPRRPSQIAGDRSTDTARSGQKISGWLEPGRVSPGLYQSRSWRDQPTSALLLSTRGYVCHLVFALVGLTVLSSSLYTQIYSKCRLSSETERSERLSLKGKCEPH